MVSLHLNFNGGSCFVCLWRFWQAAATPMVGTINGLWHCTVFYFTHWNNSSHNEFGMNKPNQPSWYLMDEKEYQTCYILHYFAVILYILHFSIKCVKCWLQQPGLNVITELVIGYIYPGKPLANVSFKTYGYISMAQALSFLLDFKLGHYMKIPPRSMFIVQASILVLQKFI